MDIGMTLLGQALSFALLILFTVKFIWPPLMAAIEERQQKIAEGLAAADRSKKDLAQAEEKVNFMNRFPVRKVAVLGAGVMGAQIAAHLVNCKVPVVLFDLPAKEEPIFQT